MFRRTKSDLLNKKTKKHLFFVARHVILLIKAYMLTNSPISPLQFVRHE